MPIFIYHFDCILQGSKFINVIAFRIWDLIVLVPDHCLSFYFRIVNNYLCLLLGNLHTNKSIVAFSGTCITVTVYLLNCDA